MRLATLCIAAVSVAAELNLGPSAYTADGIFPTSLFSSYYNNPTQTASQVQPVISDSVLVTRSMSTNDTVDPIDYPIVTQPLDPAAASDLYKNVSTAIRAIIANDAIANCSKCIQSLVQAQRLAQQAPSYVPPLMVELCNAYKFSGTDGCNVYMEDAEGPHYTQVFAYGDMAGADGQYICQHFITKSKCARPDLPEFDSSLYWTKPKPTGVSAPQPKGTNRVKVLHMSDFHVDPRYATGAEGDCTSGTCCRHGNPAASLYSNYTPTVAAPRFGFFQCDTPWALGAAAVEAIPLLTGTNGTGFNMTIFTGDLVSHDAYYSLSEAYVEYAETALYDLWKRTLNQNSPMYAAIGNHDSYQQSFDAPKNLPGVLSDQLSWNYDHLASLWQKEGWIGAGDAAEAKAHYGAYSVMHAPNLKVITLNTNLWYRANIFAYVNVTQPDNFGFLRFLATELQECEDKGIRAWVMGHVLSGWDGTNPLAGSTDQFYQIIDRYSHTIAAIFWGHTHEDQHLIYYANNGTDMSEATAQNVAWIGPSITPSTNLNSGFHMYEVDGETWDILDAHTWISNVSTYPALDSQTQFGPSYHYAYSVREAYGADIAWPENAPLNATWWHRVTEQMASSDDAGSDLVSLYNYHQSKMSALTPNCTSAECIEAKICYIRFPPGAELSAGLWQYPVVVHVVNSRKNGLCFQLSVSDGTRIVIAKPSRSFSIL